MQEQHSSSFNPPFDGKMPPPIPNQFGSERSEYLGRVYRFKFHGQAMEYFGIWIVNILLTIASLSLYAPWAKVRRLRYFYGNTEFFERFFDFTGLPTKILIGRLIALGIWGAFTLAGYLEMTIAAFGVVIIYLALPWLLRATIRFTSRNSKYANSRFYFDGTTGEAYKQFFLGALIVVCTLGLFTPVMIYFYKRYVLNHLYAGQLKFRLNNSWTDYMSAVYLPVALFVGVLMLCGISIGIFAAIGLDFLTAYTAGLLGLSYLFGWVFIVPLIQARIFITTWNNTTLGNSQFKTDCNQWRYAWIVVSNWFMKIITVGLMSAWAAIRLYKYQLESISLHLEDDPDRMMNMAQADHSAIAEEISDIFDLDISL